MTTTTALDTMPGEPAAVERTVALWLEGDELALVLGGLDLAIEAAEHIDGVRTLDAHLHAIEAIDALRQASADADRRYRAVLDPLRRVQRQVTAHRTEHLAAAKARETTLRRQVAAYMTREAEARRAAERQAADQQAAREAAAREAGSPDVPGIADASTAAQVSGPPSTPPVAPALEPPDAGGARTRTTWRAEVTDLAALVQAVAAGAVPLDVLQPDRAALGRHVRALRDTLRWPGVQVHAETTVAVARRKT